MSVLEDVHTYIHFVFYEVQKHLVTYVSMLYKDIQFRAATTKLHLTNKYCRFNGCGQNKKALLQTIGWTNLIPTTTPVHSSSKMAHCHCFCFCATLLFICIQYLSVYSINGLWVYLIYRLGNLALSYSKLPKTKDAWTVQFECMHGVA